MNTHGPVEPDKDNIRQEPYTLPQGFTWDALDLGDRGVVSRPRQSTGVDWGTTVTGSREVIWRQLLLKPSSRTLLRAKPNGSEQTPNLLPLWPA